MTEDAFLVPSNKWLHYGDPLVIGITNSHLVLASGRDILATYPFYRLVSQFGRVTSMNLEVWSNQTARVYINGEKIIDITNPRKDRPSAHLKT